MDSARTVLSRCPWPGAPSKDPPRLPGKTAFRPAVHPAVCPQRRQHLPEDGRAGGGGVGGSAGGEPKCQGRLLSRPAPRERLSISPWPGARHVTWNPGKRQRSMSCLFFFFPRILRRKSLKTTSNSCPLPRQHKGGHAIPSLSPSRRGQPPRTASPQGQPSWLWAGSRVSERLQHPEPPRSR